jgi:hypothetical protein
MKANRQFCRRLNRERLAAVLLRLLGLYFLVLAVATGIMGAGNISLASSHFGWDALVWGLVAVLSTRLAAELVIGTYLVLGGQWFFNKVLAPIARRPKQDAFTDGG